jgi:hypothetical protein
MRFIGIIAAAAGVIALSFAVSPATAVSCAEDNGSCNSARNAPMKLDQFMSTWKPVAAPKRAKKSKMVRTRSKKAAGPRVVKSAPPAETAPAPAAQTAPAPMLAAGALAPGMLAAAAEDKQTDGIGITSADEVNEIDALADTVQVVAFNEVNELDLAAPPSLAPAQETVGQAAMPHQTPADNSWIGKLLLAVAGTIALAGAARFLIA